MTLRPLSSEDMEQVRHWRHEFQETLRTPYMLTAEQQQDYYKQVICDRRSTTRYWGFWMHEPPGKNKDGLLEDGDFKFETRGWFIGYGGIENIQWESSIGEISVLIGPNYQGKGYGRAAVDAILDQAFNHLNLNTVYGECYKCSKAVGFWEHLVKERVGYLTLLPARKYWNGAYWDSLYFVFYKANK